MTTCLRCSKTIDTNSNLCNHCGSRRDEKLLACQRCGSSHVEYFTSRTECGECFGIVRPGDAVDAALLADHLPKGWFKLHPAYVGRLAKMCSGTRVHVLEFDGTRQPGWPLNCPRNPYCDHETELFQPDHDVQALITSGFVLSGTIRDGIVAPVVTELSLLAAGEFNRQACAKVVELLWDRQKARVLGLLEAGEHAESLSGTLLLDVLGLPELTRTRAGHRSLLEGGGFTTEYQVRDAALVLHRVGEHALACRLAERLQERFAEPRHTPLHAEVWLDLAEQERALTCLKRLPSPSGENPELEIAAAGVLASRLNDIDRASRHLDAAEANGRLSVSLRIALALGYSLLLDARDDAARCLSRAADECASAKCNEDGLSLEVLEASLALDVDLPDDLADLRTRARKARRQARLDARRFGAGDPEETERRCAACGRRWFAPTDTTMCPECGERLDAGDV